VCLGWRHRGFLDQGGATIAHWNAISTKQPRLGLNIDKNFREGAHMR
jgi:hypothetical protein